MRSIRKYFCYINRVYSKFLQLKKSQVNEMLKIMREAGCIVAVGEGRSFYATIIALSQLNRIKTIFTLEDPGYPSPETLVKKFGRVVYVFSTGSGKSATPLEVANDLKKFLGKRRNEIRMVTITSNPNSPVPSVTGEYGPIVVLKGRTKEEEPVSNAEKLLGVGIMGDQFELALISLLQGVVEAIHLKEDADYVLERGKRSFAEIGRLLDGVIQDKTYEKIVSLLNERRNVFLHGLGEDHYICSMTALRLMHIKRVLGSEVFVARRETTPRPMPGDLGIFISYSGRTKATLRWAKNFINLKAKIITITASERCELVEKARNYGGISMIVGDESERGKEIEAGSPLLKRESFLRFYEKTAYALSPIPILMTQELDRIGYRLPEYILRWYHSVSD